MPIKYIAITIATIIAIPIDWVHTCFAADYATCRYLNHTEELCEDHQFNIATGLVSCSYS